MEPITTTIPQQQPQTILTNIGSVFGETVPGFRLSNPQDAPQPPTQINTQPTVSAEQALDQRLIGMETAIRNLNQSMVLAGVEMESIKSQIKQIKDFIDASLASRKAPEPLVVTSTNVPNPLAPEKKKAGRPKKVIA